MTMNPRSILPYLPLVAGIGMASAGLAELRSGSVLRHSQNPFAVQGSAYGKLLARLSETTIDRVWHLGVEQIVPHSMSGESAHDDPTETLPGLASSEAPPAKLAEPVRAAVDETFLERGKHWFQERVIAQHHRTNPRSLNERHLATVHKDIERMLLRSFKLDPTHYGAYDSYHLFLTTHDFGGSPAAREQAVRVAQTAIAAAFQENEDPEPWLTAAAAGMNLYLMDAGPYMQNGSTIPLEILREYREKIGFCLQRFDEIQVAAEKRGNWERLSLERQMEISERSLFAKRTFKQFEVMIARAEAKNGETEGPDVAGKSFEE